MLATIYLIILFILGDSICRRFFTFVSIPHRLAAAFLAGLLICSWWTYLSSLLFYWTSTPLIWGNLLFFITSIAFIYWLRTRTPNDVLLTATDRTATEFTKGDWIAFGLVFLLTCFLMFATFGMRDGNILIGTHQSSDYGSTVSIMQSFARGHNFPTEFPHFSGERIRYHFLFYFQGGNLQFLGFSPAFAINILSIFSMASMLILVMSLGALVFNSRPVGRIAAALFFFHGTLSFYPFLKQFDSFSAVVNKVLTSNEFLPSGYTYRGETWGVWTQVNYVNQRHFASSIGILLLVLTFLMIRYRAANARAARIKEQQQSEAAALALAQAEWDEQLRSRRALEFSEREPQPLDLEPTNYFDSAAEERDPFIAETQQSAEPDILEIPVTDSEQVSENQIVVQPETQERENFVDSTVESPSETSDVELGVEQDSAFVSETTDREDFSVGSQLPASDQAEIQTSEEQPVAERPRKTITPSKTPGEWLSEGLEGITSFIFAGALLGLLPLWNGAVFVAAFAVLVLLFIFFPQRRQMLGLGMAAGIVALPQVYYLKSGGMADSGFSLIHWGYTIVNATVYQAVEYIGWTFGFKLLLIAIALAIGTWFQRRFFLVISSLVVLAFCFQFSLEVLTNHKFLNIWLVLANLFAASGLWFLWNLKILRTKIFGRIAAIVLTILVTLSGFFDLFPFYTTGRGETSYGNDELVRWVDENTDPNAIFLTPRWSGHRILLAGRRIFHGHPYYAWSSGYDTYKRDQIYVRMFESTNPGETFDLLKANNISYVAIDQDFRKRDEAIKKLNESFFKAYCDVVFDDEQNKFNKLTIYKVPAELGPPKPEIELPPEEPRTPVDPNAAVPAFKGGEGTSPGKFSRPRGIAVDDRGNFYVADVGNNRIQKFDQDGKFLAVFGDPGEREGRIKEPNGVAVNPEGEIFVTDASNHKLLKYNADGTFAEEYMGPDTGFYGPRDVSVALNNQVYIVDQGRTRVARFQPISKAFSYTWGTSGSNEGEFRDPTGIATGDGFTFVADLGNGRVQVFDLDGRFVRQWPIPQWEKTSSEFPDVAFDSQTKIVYVSVPKTNEVLAFDINGSPMPGFNSEGEEKLENPASMAILTANKKRWLLVVNSGSNRISRFALAASEKIDKTDNSNKTKK